jgi:cupin 2 domain-containing protein
MKVANFFSDLPEQLYNELFEAIIETKACKIERIVSRGQSSPGDFWYDQEQNEWVILLKGRATLEFEGIKDFVELGPGDYLNIPAHKKHRVEWTTPEESTVWLAIHY